MTGYFIRRLLLVIPTFIGITLAVFLVMHFVPGGPSSARSCVQDGRGLEGGGGGAVGFSTELPPKPSMN